MENGFGTAPLTQKVTGDLAYKELENEFGTAPLTQNMIGDLATMVGVATALTKTMYNHKRPLLTINDGTMGWQGVLAKGLATSRENGDNPDINEYTNKVSGGEGLVAKFLNNKRQISEECVRESINRVGTAPLSQLLKGVTINNYGVGTNEQKMQKLSDGPKLPNNVGTKGLTSILDKGVATTRDIVDIVGTKTTNDTLSVIEPTVDKIQTLVYESILCEQMSVMDNGVGIGGTLTTWLAKEPDNANN